MIPIESMIRTGDATPLLKSNDTDRIRSGGDRYIFQKLLVGGVSKEQLVSIVSKLFKEDQAYRVELLHFLR